MNLNKVFLAGRLTRDPENRALPSGQSLTTFGLATDRFYNDKEGQKQQQTEFHNVVIFGKLADTASQYLRKGSLALVEGRLQTRSWQDNSGNQRSRTEIVAERLQLGPKSGNFNQQQQQQPQQQQQQPQQQSQQQQNQEQNSSKEDLPVVEEDEEINPKDLPF